MYSPHFETYHAEQHPAEGDRKDNLRKPLSGKLYITIREARDLDHAPLLKRSSKVFNDTSVVLKVEGTARANSLPSRTDKWNQEFEISVEKANEVEVAIFDRQSGAGDGQSTPIGLLWLRLNDVVDALRRQRVGTEAQGAWVTAAGAMRDGHGPGGSPPHDTVYGQQQQQQMGFGGQPGPDAAPNQLGSEGITAWFAVEPAGALALDINFGELFRLDLLEHSLRCLPSEEPALTFHLVVFSDVTLPFLAVPFCSQRERSPPPRRCR